MLDCTSRLDRITKYDCRRVVLAGILLEFFDQQLQRFDLVVVRDMDEFML